MDLETSLRNRRMVRSFAATPVDPDLISELVDLARQAPSAGNTASTEFVVLTGAARNVYWDITLPGERRRSFTFPTLPDAGALVLVLTRPEAYLERYSEPDKARTGRGRGVDRWPVPFWWVDSGAVIQNLLLLVQDRGLGACLFGVFDHEDEVIRALGIPDDRRIVAAIAMGEPLPGRSGRSASRSRPDRDDIVHHQFWSR